VELEIQGMVVRWGAGRIGFLTFTFADDVRTIAEAQKRFHSLFSGSLSKRYPEWVCVVQRHKDDRIHFHLVIAMAEDIRTGFEFDGVARRDYTSVSRYLRDEWRFLRETLPEYQFGRHELLPLKNPQGFGMYVARYVGRTEHTRKEEKGARLVRFSKGFRRCVCGPFSKTDLIEERARKRMPEIVSAMGFKDSDHLQRDLGPSWRYHLARLLYCRDEVFDSVCAGVESDLRWCGGALFALQERWKIYDRRLAESQKHREQWEALVAAGVAEARLRGLV